MATSFNPPKVKALCLDVADVLIELDIGYAVSKLEPSAGINRTQKIYSLGKWPPYDAFERGALSSDVFLHQLKKYLDLNFNNPELISWWNSTIRKMVDGVEDILKQIIGRIPVYTLTNTNPLHVDYLLNAMPVFKEFDDFIASFHLGNRKPEREIFQKASGRIGINPRHILFIDDNAENVRGAAAVGYQAECNYRSGIELSGILSRYGIL